MEQSKEIVYKEALEAIARLDSEIDSDCGWNEWGEAECFRKAQYLAKQALAEAEDETQRSGCC